MTIAYALHLLNTVLAAIVVGLCILQSNWRMVNRIRNAKIIGMIILNIGIVWFSIDQRVEPLRPWVPLITVGLLICVYGFRQDSVHESKRQLANN